MKKGGIEPDLPIYLFIVIIFYDHVWNHLTPNIFSIFVSTKKIIDQLGN